MKCIKIIVNCKRTLIDCYRHRYQPSTQITDSHIWYFFLLAAENYVYINSNKCKQTWRITSFLMLLFWITNPAHMRKSSSRCHCLWIGICKNRRYSFSKYALYIASIYQTIPKFSINSFIYISGMLTKFGYGFQLRKNSVNDGIDTFKSTYENNI